MPKANTPTNDDWRARPLIRVDEAALLLCRSRASIYLLAEKGDLRLVQIAGRTSVRTEDVVRLIDDAPVHVPNSSRTRAAIEGAKRARAERNARFATPRTT